MSLETAVREALEEYADHVKPAALGQRALAGARRRAQRRANAAAASLVVIVLLAVATVSGGPGRQLSAPSAPAGSVIAAYYTPTDVQVLVPTTGRYRGTDLAITAVSPDLRYAAATADRYHAGPPPDQPRLAVLDTHTGAVRWFDLPERVEQPTWSPDGTLIAARVATPPGRSAVIVNRVTGHTALVPLDLPTNHVVTRLAWSGPDRLYTVSAPGPDTGDPGAGDPGAGDRDKQFFTVLDGTGAVVRRVTVAATWRIGKLTNGPRILLTRLSSRPAGRAVVPPEVAVVNLDDGTVGPTVELDWPGAIESLAPRGDGSFVALGYKERERLIVVNPDDASVDLVRDGLYPEGTKYFVVLPATDLPGPAAPAVF